MSVFTAFSSSGKVSRKQKRFKILQFQWSSIAWANKRGLKYRAANGAPLHGLHPYRERVQFSDIMRMYRKCIPPTSPPNIVVIIYMNKTFGDKLLARFIFAPFGSLTIKHIRRTSADSKIVEESRICSRKCRRLLSAEWPKILFCAIIIIYAKLHRSFSFKFEFYSVNTPIK